MDVKDKKLVLSANATRRAIWHRPLGFQTSKAFIVSISKLVQDGGAAPCIDVIITRKMPVYFIETLPDGEKIVLSGHEEDYAQNLWQKSCEESMHILGEEVANPGYIDGSLQIHNFNDVIFDHLL